MQTKNFRFHLQHPANGVSCNIRSLSVHPLACFSVKKLAGFLAGWTHLLIVDRLPVEPIGRNLSFWKHSQSVHGSAPMGTLLCVFDWHPPD